MFNHLGRAFKMRAAGIGALLLTSTVVPKGGAMPSGRYNVAGGICFYVGTIYLVTEAVKRGVIVDEWIDGHGDLPGLIECWAAGPYRGPIVVECVCVEFGSVHYEILAGIDWGDDG